MSAADPGGVELLLEPNGNPIAATYQRALHEAGIPATSFAVADIDAEHERLDRAGVVFPVPPTPPGPVRSAVFDDTCGNLIGLHQVS